MKLTPLSFLPTSAPSQRKTSSANESAPSDDAERGGEQHALQQRRQWPPVAPLREDGPLPEQGEPDERDDEHGGRAVVEDVPRDREVTNPPDPVGKQPGHLTVSWTIWSARLSSSASNTPAIVAGNTIRTVPPAVTSLCRS